MAEFYFACSKTIPPLPGQSFALPFSAGAPSDNPRLLLAHDGYSGADGADDCGIDRRPDCHSGGSCCIGLVGPAGLGGSFCESHALDRVIFTRRHRACCALSLEPGARERKMALADRWLAGQRGPVADGAKNGRSFSVSITETRANIYCNLAQNVRFGDERRTRWRYGT